jgi:hypothetical protein
MESFEEIIQTATYSLDDLKQRDDFLLKAMIR